MDITGRMNRISYNREGSFFITNVHIKNFSLFTSQIKVLLLYYCNLFKKIIE